MWRQLVWTPWMHTESAWGNSRWLTVLSVWIKKMTGVLCDISKVEAYLRATKPHMYINAHIHHDCGLQRKDSRWFCLCVNVYKWWTPNGVSKRRRDQLSFATKGCFNNQLCVKVYFKMQFNIWMWLWDFLKWHDWFARVLLSRCVHFSVFASLCMRFVTEQSESG